MCERSVIERGYKKYEIISQVYEKQNITRTDFTHTHTVCERAKV